MLCAQSYCQRQVNRTHGRRITTLLTSKKTHYLVHPQTPPPTLGVHLQPILQMPWDPWSNWMKPRTKLTCATTKSHDVYKNLIIWLVKIMLIVCLNRLETLVLVSTCMKALGLCPRSSITCRYLTAVSNLYIVHRAILVAYVHKHLKWHQRSPVIATMWCHALPPLAGY